MHDEDLIREFWEAYEAELSGRNSEDYELNKPQFKKYLDVCRILTKAAEEYGGRVDPLRIAPAEEHCGITVYAPLYYFHNDSVLQLADALRGVSGVSIDCTTDGDVCISVVVPNVFRKKE